MSAAMVGQSPKTKNRPKKLNLDQNINDSKSHIQNSFFENIITGMQCFYIRPHVPVDIIRVCFFLNFQIFQQDSLKINKYKRKRSLISQYSFVQETSLILRTSTHLTLKIICTTKQSKTFLTLQIFQQTCFCLVTEKTFGLHHFLTPKKYILEAI